MVETEYAKALFELAMEENKMDLMLDHFILVLDIAQEQEDFMKVISLPSIEKVEKIKIIEKAFYQLDATFIDFLKVLIENQRFQTLHQIKDEYIKILRVHHRILKIDIISSIKLLQTKMKQITKSLELRYPGKELHIENVVNPKILGGMQIICDGVSLDMSLKNQLSKIKDSL